VPQHPPEPSRGTESDPSPAGGDLPFITASSRASSVSPVHGQSPARSTQLYSCAIQQRRRPTPAYNARHRPATCGNNHHRLPCPQFGTRPWVQIPPPQLPVRQVSVSRLGRRVSLAWLVYGGLGRLGHPQHPVLAAFGELFRRLVAMKPGPPRLSCTRSSGTRGTAWWDHLCVITGEGGPRRWGGPDLQRGADTTTDA
jgi:hypothetical protein